MKRILGSVFASCLLLGAVTPVVSGFTATPAGAANAPQETALATLLNQDRATHGLPPLPLDQRLTAIARRWSDHLMTAHGLSHNPALTSQVPAGWLAIGENVAMGWDAPSIEQTFMNSPVHRDNILGDYTSVGVGVDVGSDGALWVTVDFMKSPRGPVIASCSNSNPVAAPNPAAASGYYVLGSDGGVFSYGASFFGSVPQLGIRASTITMTATPDQRGYWVLGSDGGVFAFGDAHYAGSVPGLHVVTSAIDLKASPSGEGYWILGRDGGVFTFGDAAFHGSLPQIGVHTRAVKLIPTRSGNGYWILGADGGVFSFGDASYLGSLPQLGIRDVSVSLANTPSSNGYWILGADGGVFSFGDASYHGSIPGMGCQSAVGVQLAPTSTGNGYYLLGQDGRVFPFGDATDYGNPSGLHVSAVDIAVLHP
ncbi:MAG: CAP domain-containing protein [Acidimicrobiales bacterium]